VVRGDAACASLDSTLARGLPALPRRSSGRSTFDVADYRVRGHYTLTVRGRDAIAFQFEGTMLMGGHREDVAVSLMDDTLRVLDRERGAYYVGPDVDAMIEKGTGVGGAWVDAIREVMGFSPGCTDRVEMRSDREHVSGLIDGGAFVLTTDGAHLLESSWPDPTASRTFSDRLEVRYDWKAGRLAGITASLPRRGWRIRLAVDSSP